MNKFIIALSVAFAACGSPEPELGQTEEALSIPSGFGFSTDGQTTTCFQGTRTCYMPATKHLRTITPVVLTGSCNSSIWSDDFTLARGNYNANVNLGTGYSASNTQLSGFDPVITTRCVSSLPNQARIGVTSISGIVCFANGCQYSNLRLDIAGDTVINDCKANHFSNAQCRDYIAGWFQAGLNHISGVSDFPVSFTPAAPEFQRMADYRP